jgi:hypothetical protein
MRQRFHTWREITGSAMVYPRIDSTDLDV